MTVMIATMTVMIATTTVMIAIMTVMIGMTDMAATPSCMWAICLRTPGPRMLSTFSADMGGEEIGSEFTPFVHHLI